MRARYPDSESFVERDGVKVAYEVFGSGEPTLVFAPTEVGAVDEFHRQPWRPGVGRTAGQRGNPPAVGQG